MFSRDFDEIIEDCRHDDLLSIVPRILPSKNMIYAFMIQAHFGELGLCAGEGKANAFRDIKGTVTGFYYPGYLKNITGKERLFFCQRR